MGQGAWWCLVWVDILYPSGRNRWTSGTVRGQRRGGGCCRPSVPPRSGRTRPQRAPTASRSTFLKPRLDSETRTEASPSHLFTHPHPRQSDLCTSPFLSPVFGVVCRSLLINPVPSSSAFPSVHLPLNSVLMLIKQATEATLVS